MNILNNTGLFTNKGSKHRFCKSIEINDLYFTHDSSAALILNGEIIYANAEERFSKIKHDGSSIEKTLENIESTIPTELSDYLDRNSSYGDNQLSHHKAHIYETFYDSGFKEAAVLINDGYGTENDSITLAYMKKGETPLILKKFDKENSLGVLYNIFSHIINPSSICINGIGEEGKLMGLASYGIPLEDKFVEFKNNSIKWNKNIIDEYLTSLQDKINNGEMTLVQKATLAATIQRDFEDCVISVVKYFKNLLIENGINTSNLCMSGGCLLNCPTNSKIVDLGLFEHYYCCPNPGDGSTVIGELYNNLIIRNHDNAFTFKGLHTSYLGYDYSTDDIIDSIPDSINSKVIHSWNKICDLLKKQNVICWFQGGAEFGPRALGHRSMLADPRDRRMTYKLNNIKGREQWRPLAPIVPEELFKDVFEVENTDMCEFMLRTLTIKPEWRKVLKAVCHVDNTARPQLLKRDINPKLYDLLMTWYKKTGCPCLVNTSLNTRGLPIAETPYDVIDILKNSNEKLYAIFNSNNISILTEN